MSPTPPSDRSAAPFELPALDLALLAPGTQRTVSIDGNIPCRTIRDLSGPRSLLALVPAGQTRASITSVVRRTRRPGGGYQIRLLGLGEADVVELELRGETPWALLGPVDDAQFGPEHPQPARDLDSSTQISREELRRREHDQLTRRIAATPLPPAARLKLLREAEHLRLASTASPDTDRIRNYLEWMLELPWAPPETKAGLDPQAFARVRKRLNESHTGLDDVKDRVVEFLAVRQLRQQGRGAIVCLLGPPGTGKSSMGRAVARALGRKFVHIAVGSFTDEAEVRGTAHRREDGGPGAILRGIHRGGHSNAVVLLDELDKLQLGNTGTSGGALVDVLDPEQNRAFIDEYAGVPFDLSHCVFLATANDLAAMPEALQDRLEVIHFSGYTESEKLSIARKHLLPQMMKNAGLERGELRLSPAALLTVVRNYTEEAGVRHLRRTLGSLARKAAVDVVKGGEGLTIKRDDLLGLLGPSIADEDLRRRKPEVGVSTGLAWTLAGGALLPVEALAMHGTGRTILTGLVGEVMRESVQTALSFVRTLFDELGIRADALETIDIHVHFPSAAVPKDGPSAGISIAIALLSLITRTPVRHDVALTGELSLHGKVLPVGGLRDKLLATIRNGIPEVVVPARNAEEVLRMPADIRSKLTIHLIDEVREAFGLVLHSKPGAGPAQRPDPVKGRAKTRRAQRRGGA